jgi:predicted hydrocarbon binding protein
MNRPDQKRKAAIVQDRRIPSMLLNTLLTQIDETMGRRGLIKLLRQAGLPEYVDDFPPLLDTPSIPVHEYSRLVAHIYYLFGAQDARSIFLRSGRQNAVELRRKWPAQFTVVGTALRLVANTRRMQLVLDKLAEQTQEIYGATCQVSEEEGAFFFTIAGCPFCSAFARQGQKLSRLPTRPVCHILASTIEEMMEWATGQKHLVEELECSALGAPACQFRIGK